MYAIKGKDIVEEVIRTFSVSKAVPLNKDAFFALNVLRSWDFNLSSNSVGAAVYEVSRHLELFNGNFKPVYRCSNIPLIRICWNLAWAKILLSLFWVRGAHVRKEKLNNF